MQRLIQRIQSSTPRRRRLRHEQQQQQQQQQQQLMFDEDTYVGGDTVSCSSFSSLGEDESTTEQDRTLALSLQERQDEEDLLLAYHMSILDGDAAGNDSFVMVNDYAQQQDTTSPSAAATSSSLEHLTPLMSMMNVAAIEEEGQELILHSVMPPPLWAASSSSSTPPMTRFLVSDLVENCCDDDTDDDVGHELCYDCLVQANLRFFQVVLGSPEQQAAPAPELCESCRARNEMDKKQHQHHAQDGDTKPKAPSRHQTKVLRFEKDDPRTRGNCSRRQYKKPALAPQSTSPRATTSTNIAIRPKTSGIYQKFRGRRLGGRPGASATAGDVCGYRPTLLDQRAPLSLYMYGDEDVLSPFDCLLRKNLQYYEYFDDHGTSNAATGRVGIRCCNCSHLNHSGGGGGGAFPVCLSDIHAAARQIATTHLMTSCCPVNKQNRVAAELKRLLYEEKNWSSSSSSPKNDKKDRHYWAESAKASGIFETGAGLGWTSFLPGEGDTRRRFLHKQFSKTMRSGAMHGVASAAGNSSSNAIYAL